jgi:hypothetical protein
MIVAILAIVYHSSRTMHWVVVGLAIDTIIRVLYGLNASPTGMIANLLLANIGVNPKIGAGAPKQFGAFLTVILTAIAIALFFTGAEVGGAVLMGFVAALLALEGVLGLCCGTALLDWAINRGYISGAVYKIYHSTREHTVASLNSSHLCSAETQAEPTVIVVSDGTPSATDLKYKVKTGKPAFHPIKYIHAGYFDMPHAVMGLAIVWKVAASVFDAPPIVWQIVAYIAAVVFTSYVVLFALRLALYPRKVIKDYTNVAKAGAFSQITISFMLMGVVAQDHFRNLATVRLLLHIARYATL